MKTKAIGTESFKTGDFQEAINKFSLAIQQCPNDEKRNKAMLHNNIGLCLLKMYESTAESEQPAQPADGQKELFSFQKNKRANTDKDKANEQAKEHFGKAIGLDEMYVKPHYQRMMLLK